MTGREEKAVMIRLYDWNGSPRSAAAGRYVRTEMKGKLKARRTLILFLAAALLLPWTGCAESDITEEEGYDEIRGIVEIQPSLDPEGKNLEELTQEVTEQVMGEYYDPVSGLRMQYPLFLQFRENEPGNIARSEDGHFSMSVESIPDGQQLTADILKEALLLQEPEGKIREYTSPACLVMESTEAEQFRIDIYVLNGNWLHHILMTGPAEEKGFLTPYIEYMIHSMENDEKEVG